VHGTKEQGKEFSRKITKKTKHMKIELHGIRKTISN
jgi:hypothetical protein